MTVIKYPMDMVFSGWSSHPHACRLDGGQASYCNVVVVSVKPAVWSGVCVFINVLLGYFRHDVIFFCVCVC